MADKDVNIDRFVSSDNYIFVEEYIEDSDDEFNRNISASKLGKYVVY